MSKTSNIITIIALATIKYKDIIMVIDMLIIGPLIMAFLENLKEDLENKKE